MEFLNAIFLGIVEGLTEFLPISSTGHLILFVDLLGFKGPPGRVFEVAIQFGAILAVIVAYRQKLWEVVIQLPTAKPAQHFVRNVLLAVIPAMAIGVLAHDVIKTALFNPTVVACALILGGIAILVIEKIKPPPTVTSTEELSWQKALAIGFIQCIAMVPGTSRSGATIMGALMLGVERKAAAEFSFFLAIPTMLAAASYDFYQARHALDMQGMQLILIGFMAAFLVALVVVRWLVRFVQHHGFQPFAWYRIVLGIMLLALLYR